MDISDIITLYLSHVSEIAMGTFLGIFLPMEILNVYKERKKILKSMLNASKDFLTTSK